MSHGATTIVGDVLQETCQNYSSEVGNFRCNP
jgi:hypothetical protein